MIFLRWKLFSRNQSRTDRSTLDGPTDIWIAVGYKNVNILPCTPSFLWFFMTTTVNMNKIICKFVMKIINEKKYTITFFYQKLSVSKNFIYSLLIKTHFNHVHREIKILVSHVFQITLHFHSIIQARIRGKVVEGVFFWQIFKLLENT